MIFQKISRKLSKFHNEEKNTTTKYHSFLKKKMNFFNSKISFLRTNIGFKTSK